jgi:hypothetical protein
VAWEVEVTDEFDQWMDALARQDLQLVIAAVDELEAQGPGLGRPRVDTLAHTRVHNLKELRIPGSAVRILFAFDPRRTAILLVGGDKAGQWSRWYEQMIPVAEDLYERHLETLRKEGLI